MKKIGLISLGFFIFDQIIKQLICSKLALNESIDVINSFFSITYVRNYGAAFSILEGNRFFLVTVAILVLLIIYFFFLKNKTLNKLDIITYSLLIGGIFGNLADRIIYGYVIDFLSFNVFGFYFPIFNFADIFIVTAAFLIIITTLLGDKENEKL